MKLSVRNALFVLAAALAIAFIGRTAVFYRGAYQGPQVPVSTPSLPQVLADTFSGKPEVDGSGEQILIDQAHSNAFRQDELTFFFSRMTDVGAGLRFADSQEEFLDGLARASSVIVIAPEGFFSREEADAIAKFVAKGGHLIIIGDPTRMQNTEAINSLASRFGLIYQQDFIYNLSENDGGYANVIFSEFGEDLPLTEGLDEVVFQTAHSLRAPQDAALILGDGDTFSSRSEVPGGVIAAALTADERVLALPDMTFLTSPFNSFADNDLLIANIVAFAVTAERSYELADFPAGFSGPTRLVFEDALVFNEMLADAVKLRSQLAEAGIEGELSDTLQDSDEQMLYFALYDTVSEDMLELLDDAGIVVTPDEIEIEDVAVIEQRSTTFFHLLVPEESDDEEPGPARLVVLAQSESDLAGAIEALLDGSVAGCQVSPVTAICADSAGGAGGDGPSEDSDLPGGTGGDGSILIVADDESSPGPNEATSAIEIADALDELGADYDVVSTLEDGPPTADTLVEYTVVFWTAGDYCCNSPSDAGADALTEYLDGGGSLFIDGMFIATDWSDTPFLDALGATLDGFGGIVDLAPEDHPLSDGFPDEVTLVDQEEPLLADIVQPVAGAEVVFGRGPESVQPGEPALIAYDPGDYRVAYAAFPLYLMQPDDLTLLIENALLWFDDGSAGEG